MKLGVVISMYDEIDIVLQTISILRESDCIVIVVQSDPGDDELILKKSISDEFFLLPDLAGNRDNYKKMFEHFKNGGTLPIAPSAVTRNFSKGFSEIKKFDVDFVVAIEGDTQITNCSGILEIIKKMKDSGKIISCTRTLGYVLHDENGKLERFQDNNSTDIMPQFFIADFVAVRQGLFCKMTVTNPFTSEVCLGDEVQRYCKEKNLDFFNSCNIISDYAYPKNIEGIQYNPEQISTIPHFLENYVTEIRKRSGRGTNDFITNVFKILSRFF
jgi:hypothetical protein